VERRAAPSALTYVSTPASLNHGLSAMSPYACAQARPETADFDQTVTGFSDRRRFYIRDENELWLNREL
jgi:hypothetical protein